MENYTDIVARQKRFFDSGCSRDIEFRRNSLLKLKKAVLERQDDIADALQKDLNKPAAEAYMTETGLLTASINHALKHLKRWTRKKHVWPGMAVAPANCKVVPEPYGSCLIIAPWNYPVLLSLDPLVSALAAGNCAVIKPSETAPASSSVIKKIIEDCFNRDYIFAAEGGREETEALLDAGFDYIFFTGSPEKGRMVMAKAAEKLIPVTLELGGKSPCIIDEGTPLDKAMKRIVFGKLLNAGQTCVAPDYLLVHVSHKEALVPAFEKQVADMLGKNPLDNKSYASIINGRHFARLVSYMKQGRILSGGTYRNDTLQICPTLLEITDSNVEVMQEEIFGPILPVLYFRDFNDAIHIANAKDKPLALYVFTENTTHEKEALLQIPAGGVCINDCMLHLSCQNLPFGGVGKSGMGYSHGKYGFETFCRYKAVLKKPYNFDIPVRYRPYTKFKLMLAKMFLR